MTRSAAARSSLVFLAAALSVADSTRAGIWYSEPVLGLAADYSTNPGLLNAPHTAETHGAVLIDGSTTYHADGVSLALQPSLRLTDSAGYSTLGSDYEHLASSAKLVTERDALTLSGQAARDSSLYYNYAVNGSTGVRRDSTLVDAAWTHDFTERLNVGADVNSSRVLYGKSYGRASLTDYRYSSAAPTLSYQLSERSTLDAGGSVGKYVSADGTTKSVNYSLELGFMRRIDEAWSVTAKGGASRETNSIAEYSGRRLLATPTSTTNGSVFTANLSRQGLLFGMNATASRSLVPTGFAYLARQDSYQVGVNYTASDRWTFEGHANWLRSRVPQTAAPDSVQTYENVGLSTTWLLTEKWTLTLRASRLVAKSSTATVPASGAGLQFSRRFDRIKWHRTAP
ncbi:MAG: hypothetical protein M3N97_15700 [Pseudomonadota bacterium]|nr:hypothetical protein [Pseudomonadota bacterium]